MGVIIVIDASAWINIPGVWRIVPILLFFNYMVEKKITFSS